MINSLLYQKSIGDRFAWNYHNPRDRLTTLAQKNIQTIAIDLQLSIGIWAY